MNSNYDYFLKLMSNEIKDIVESRRKQVEKVKIRKYGYNLYYIFRSYTNLMKQRSKILKKALYMSTLYTISIKPNL